MSAYCGSSGVLSALLHTIAWRLHAESGRSAVKEDRLSTRPRQSRQITLNLPS
ncbi:hypothetical protein BDZ89DRAFT_1059020, partial [Hymenopellis radicata]